MLSVAGTRGASSSNHCGICSIFDPVLVSDGAGALHPLWSQVVEPFCGAIASGKHDAV